MKEKRIVNFVAFVIGLIFIVGGFIGYVKLNEFNSNVWQSKALIAQVQPAIVQAQSQANINNAAAFSVYVNSALVASMVWFIPLLALIIIVIAVFWWLKNAKL